MKKALIGLTVLSSLLMSSSAFAGDASSASVLGFSPDGKYFSYMEFGVQDGSGSPYAFVKFLDVAANKYAAPTVQVVVEPDASNEFTSVKTVRKRALLQARRSLRTLRISKSNLGELLASRKLSDLTPTQNKLRFSRHAILPGLASEQYELSLEEKTAPRGARCSWAEYSPRMMKLSIKNLSNGRTTVLQNDTALPGSRGCVRSYRIQDVIAREEGDREVVVLLNVYTQGFEGDDSRTMAVSGILPE